SHWAELRIASGLAERRTMSGHELAIGLEMLPREEQADIERWRKGDLSEEEFLKACDWEKAWGYDFGFYRPPLQLAKSEGLAVIALNAPGELTRAVAKKGLLGLSDALSKQLPELDVTDAEHKAWFRQEMRDHPNHHASFENLYAAQVVWDESMADAA